MSVFRGNPSQFFEQLAPQSQPQTFSIPTIPKLSENDTLNMLVVLGIVSITAITIIAIVGIVCYLGSRGK